MKRLIRPSLRLQFVPRKRETIMPSTKMPISIEALAAFLLLSHFSCEAATLRVPSDYPTIQDAIHAAARSGDTVLVSPGTYVEVLQLNKSLTLTSTKGATETAVVGDTNSPVLWISLRANESATISGFKFTRGLVGVITSNRDRKSVV